MILRFLAVQELPDGRKFVRIPVGWRALFGDSSGVWCVRETLESAADPGI